MLAGGFSWKDGFIHSCVYNRARAIDKKENDKYTVEPETGLWYMLAISGIKNKTIAKNNKATSSLIIQKIENAEIGKAKK